MPTDKPKPTAKKTSVVKLPDEIDQPEEVETVTPSEGQVPPPKQKADPKGSGYAFRNYDSTFSNDNLPVKNATEAKAFTQAKADEHKTDLMLTEPDGSESLMQSTTKE